MFLRKLSSVGHFSSCLHEDWESLSELKILSNVLTGKGQVLSAANFTILVHNMASAGSAVGLGFFVVAVMPGKEQ